METAACLLRNFVACTRIAPWDASDDQVSVALGKNPCASLESSYLCPWLSISEPNPSSPPTSARKMFLHVSVALLEKTHAQLDCAIRGLASTFRPRLLGNSEGWFRNSLPVPELPPFFPMTCGCNPRRHRCILAVELNLDEADSEELAFMGLYRF